MIRSKMFVDEIATTRTRHVAATLVVTLSMASCSGKLQTVTHDEDARAANTGGTTNGGGGKIAVGEKRQPGAQGAVTLSISPTPGQVCNRTSPQLSVPSAENASVFGELLGVTAKTERPGPNASGRAACAFARLT